MMDTMNVVWIYAQAEQVYQIRISITQSKLVGRLLAYFIIITIISDIRGINQNICFTFLPEVG